MYVDITTILFVGSTYISLSTYHKGCTKAMHTNREGVGVRLSRCSSNKGWIARFWHGHIERDLNMWLRSFSFQVKPIESILLLFNGIYALYSSKHTCITGCVQFVHNLLTHMGPTNVSSCAQLVVQRAFSYMV